MVVGSRDQDSIRGKYVIPDLSVFPPGIAFSCSINSVSRRGHMKYEKPPVSFSEMGRVAGWKQEGPMPA